MAEGDNIAGEGQVQPTEPVADPPDQSTQPPAPESTPEPPEATEPPAPTQTQTPQTPPTQMPYEAFQQRIAAKNRKIDELKAENERLAAQSQQQVAPQPQSAQTMTEAQRLIAEANADQFERINRKVDKMAEEQQQTALKAEYNDMRNKWWNQNQDISPDIRRVVDERLDLLVAQGQFLNPDLVLQQAVGEATLASTRARGESFSQVNAQASQANQVTSAPEQRPVQPAETSTAPKSVSDMTSEEIEAEYGNVPI